MTKIAYISYAFASHTMGLPQKLPIEIERILDYTFTNEFLPNEALSFDLNRRLALVGDRVLGLLIALKCYRTGKAPVDANSMFIAVASNANL